MNLLPHMNLVLAVAALISPQLVLVEAKGITLSAPLEELPVKTGNVMGDSHFELWSGEWYEYQGACDLKMITAPNFEHGMTLNINIRTAIRFDYSHVESAVVQVGNDTLEVGSYGQYYWNGVQSNHSSFHALSGFPISQRAPQENVHIFEIELDFTERIVINVFKDMVDVKLDKVHKTRFRGSQGLLGDFETGTMFARDSSTIMDDPNLFAQEWQIRDDEPMLFHTRHSPQYPETCRLPKAKKKIAETRRLGESAVTQ